MKIADDVLVLDTGMRGVFDASENGVLAYLSSAMRPQQELVWFTRSGQREARLMDLRDYAFALSPDGQHVAFQKVGTSGAEDLWTIETQRGLRTRITRSPVPEGHPVWSRRGRAIVYTTGGEGKENIHWMSLDRPSQDVVPHTDERRSSSPIGRATVAICCSERPHPWKAASGRCRSHHRHRPPPVRRNEWSPRRVCREVAHSRQTVSGWLMR